MGLSVSNPKMPLPDGQPESSRQGHTQIRHKANQVSMFIVEIAVENPGFVGGFFQDNSQDFSLLIPKQHSQRVETGTEILFHQPDQFRQVAAFHRFLDLLVKRRV